MKYQILNETDVKNLITIDIALEAINECFIEKTQGGFSDYSKFDIQGINGPLRITAGESQSISKVIGFRLYDLIRKDYSDQEQVIVVYDNTAGRLKGIIVSQLLGAYRTAAINAIMHSKFKKQNVEVFGVVGIGFQSRIHVEMFYKLLKPKKIAFYARNKQKAYDFQREMSKKINSEIEFIESIEELYSLSDSLLLATNSRNPILKEQKIKKTVTITTIGPKLLGMSEVATEFAEKCDLVITDSIEQVKKYGKEFFIQQKPIYDYAHLLKANKAKRRNEDNVILICSVGMGGTEVVLGNKLIEKKQELTQNKHR